MSSSDSAATDISGRDGSEFQGLPAAAMLMTTAPTMTAASIQEAVRWRRHKRSDLLSILTSPQCGQAGAVRATLPPHTMHASRLLALPMPAGS